MQKHPIIFKNSINNIPRDDTLHDNCFQNLIQLDSNKRVKQLLTYS